LKVNKETIYKILLFALIFSIPFGSYLFPFTTPFGSFHGYRIILMISFPILLINKDIIFFKGKFSKLFAGIAILWLVYGALSYFWVIDKSYFIKEIFYISVGFTSILVLHSLFYKLENAISIFLKAWFVGFLAISVLAFFEMNTGFHLDGNYAFYMQTLSPNNLANWTPVTTFDNPNNYSSYLVVSACFALILGFRTKKYFGLILFVTIMSWAISYVSHSRISIISLVLLTSVFVLYTKKNWLSEVLNYRKQIIGVFSLVVLTFSILLISQQAGLYKEFGSTQFPNNELLDIANGNINRDNNLSNITETLNRPNKSNSSRLGLYKNGFYFLISTYGRGVGAGNFDPYILNKLGKYDTGGMINPHSWIIQILSQYGLVVFIPLLIWALMVFIQFIKTRNQFDTNSKQFTYGLLGLCMLMLYMSISNSTSSFVYNKLNWVSLVIIIICADLSFKNETQE
jgi:teichuronic acid biosynthesis protein TuaE